jgi:long-subunit acyl-CoA synthetase (AMP-forming)
MTTTRPDAAPAPSGDALDASTVCEAFQITAAQRPDDVALRTIGDAVSITWGEYAARVREIAAGLAALGLKRGDTFACMLVNRPEFHLVDAAAMHLGATSFSIYNTSSPEQIAYLFGDAEPRILVTEAQYLDRIRESGAALEHIVLVDGQADGVLTLDELVARGNADSASAFDFEATWRAVGPDDVLTLIYTSGTTGPPKGVELTHSNLIAMLRELRKVLQPESDDDLISFLPHAHIADRGVVHYASQVLGWKLTDCPDPKQLLPHLIDARPRVWGGVPRIFEKLKAALEAGFAAEQDEQKRGALEQALALGREKVALEQAAQPVPDELAARCAQMDELVFSGIRAQLGLDRARISVVGAAATSREVMEFFAAIGLPICEVWGMSETTAIATINPPGAQRFGTVGKPLPGVDVKLDDDGEILVKGPIVMRGYRNLPDKTRETFNDDGYLRTGDIGQWTDEGYLKLIDRKKELIINAAGKNMSPANIESTLKSASPLIGQAVCVGDARPYNVALIVLDPDVAPAVAAKLGAEGASLEQLAGDERVRGLVADAVEQANARLSRVEQIKKFTLLPAEWQPGGDELTPTMKLKRKPIAAKYADDIEALYAP